MPEVKEAYVTWAKSRDQQRAALWKAQAVREAGAQIPRAVEVGDLLQLSSEELRYKQPTELPDSLLDASVLAPDMPVAERDRKPKEPRLTPVGLDPGALRVLQGVEKHRELLKEISPEREKILVSRLRMLVEKWEMDDELPPMNY